MRKKFKLSIMIAVIFILVGGILAANWYFGQMLSQEIETEIARQVEIDDELEDVTYSNLVVNPLLSSISFEELVITEDESSIEAENIEFKFGLTDIINLAQQDDMTTFDELNYFRFEVDDFKLVDQSGIDLIMQDFILEMDGYYQDNLLQELNEFNLKATSLDYKFKQAENSIKTSELEVLFNGYITDKMLDEAENILAYDQNLDFSVAEVNFSAADSFEELLFEEETANKLFNIDQLAFKLAYDAGDHILTIDDSKINTPIVEGKSSYKYYFNEDYQFDTFDTDDHFLLKGESEGYMKIDAEDLAWGDPNLTGRYSIDRIKGDNEFDSEIVYDDLITILTSPSQSESEFLLEGFKVDFAGELREEIQSNPLLFMFGIGINDLRIDHWSMNSKESLEEVLTESEFRSPLLNTDFNFQLAIDDEEPEMSEVKDLEVKFSNLHPSLEMLLMEMSQPLGISLTQDGEDILFNRQGYLKEIIDDFSVAY